MRLKFHSVHFSADQKLLDFIQRKADKLHTYNDQILNGEVFLRLEKGEHSRENKVVEFKINLPGTTLFVKQQETSFEAATDHVMDSMSRQVKKHKQKHSPRH